MKKGAKIALISLVILLVLCGGIVGGLFALGKFAINKADETLDRAIEQQDQVVEQQDKVFDLVDKVTDEINENIEDSDLPISDNEEPGDYQYPAIYKQHDLPEYPEARLIDLGDQQESITVGLFLTAQSESSFQEIADYYDTELEKLGWTIPDEGLVTETMLVKNYKLGSTHGFTLSGYRVNMEVSEYNISFTEF